MSSTPDTAPQPDTDHPRAQSGVEIVAAIYEFFGRGDVPAILDRLREDVSWDADWLDNTAQRAGLDHMAARRGRDGVAQFFEVVSAMTFHDFRVLDLMSSDRHVVAQIALDLTLPNGVRVQDEELHLWTLDEDGRVRAMRHYIDTAKHIAAAGADTASR